MWGIHLLVSFAPATIPRITDIGLDRYVLGFTLLISLLTAIVFGLVPALQASKTDLNEVLKEGTRSASSGGRRRAALRRLLVVAEVALSFVLLVSAGLLIESIRRLSDVNPGFNTQNLLTARVSLPSDQSVADEQTEAGALKKVEKSARFLGDVEQRIAALPGVKTVGAINNLPVSGTSDVNGDFNIEGRPKYHAGEAPVAEFRLVTPGYFTAIGIPLLKGRTFGEGLRPQDELAVIVNETLARQFFPGEDPIGKRLIVMDDKPHSIIGVAGDARQWSLDLPAAAEIYFPYSQLSFNATTTLVVRTTVEPASLGDTVRRAVREVNRDAPVFGIRSMQEVLELSTAQRRFNTALITIFAGIALLLAIVGLYGVISYSFAQRTQEIGIRMALGAQAGSVLRMVLWFGLKLVLSGIAIGIVASFALTRVLTSLLFGVSANDPITIVAGALFLTITALLASYIPARRATKVDPMIALRYE
jgi:putative ABC transport system permease protein